MCLQISECQQNRPKSGQKQCIQAQRTFIQYDKGTKGLPAKERVEMARWKMIRADIETWEALKALAEEKGVSVSKILSELISQYRKQMQTQEKQPTYTTGLSQLEEAATKPVTLEKDWQFWEIYHTLQSYFQRFKEEPKRLEELREKRIAEGAHPKIIERLDGEIEQYYSLDGEIKTLDDFVNYLIEFWRETMKCPNTADRLQEIWRRTKQWLEGQK